MRQNVLPTQEILAALDRIGAVQISISTIARHAGLGRRTVRRWLHSHPVSAATDARLRATLGLPGNSPPFPAHFDEALEDLALCRKQLAPNEDPGAPDYPATGTSQRVPVALTPWRLWRHQAAS